MKILFQASMIVFLFFSSLTLAEHSEHTHEHEELPKTKQVDGTSGADCKNVIDVRVNGLVCDFCARALEKVFGRRDDVLGIDVDLNNGKVSIAMKDGFSIDNDTLTKLIMDSGYNVVEINKGC